VNEPVNVRVFIVPVPLKVKIVFVGLVGNPIADASILLPDRAKDQVEGPAVAMADVSADMCTFWSKVN
jgi:hypothetical protein